MLPFRDNTSADWCAQRDQDDAAYAGAQATLQLRALRWLLRQHVLGWLEATALVLVGVAVGLAISKRSGGRPKSTTTSKTMGRGLLATVWSNAIGLVWTALGMSQLKATMECKTSLPKSGSAGRLNAGSPKHIAVIMDGNRRFGKEKFNDPLHGHWIGGQTLVDFVSWCVEEGLEVATLYAFSSENWSRDPNEVNALMSIFIKYAEQLTTEAVARNMRVHVLSTGAERLPMAVQEAVQRLVQTTSDCTGFTVNICISYGGRDEIIAACSKIATEAVAQTRLTLLRRRLHGERNEDEAIGEVAEEEENAEGKETEREVKVSEELFQSKLCTAHSGDPDILLRTSGEFRLSNFLLWQLAYTELFFVDKFWPEMTREDLRDVLRQFGERSRRYGS